MLTARVVRRKMGVRHVRTPPALEHAAVGPWRWQGSGSSAPWLHQERRPNSTSSPTCSAKREPNVDWVRTTFGRNNMVTA